jgi:hypothetical protein
VRHVYHSADSAQKGITGADNDSDHNAYFNNRDRRTSNKRSTNCMKQCAYATNKAPHVSVCNQEKNYNGYFLLINSFN